jgi:hypothetical protein
MAAYVEHDQALLMRRWGQQRMVELPPANQGEAMTEDIPSSPNPQHEIASLFLLHSSHLRHSTNLLQHVCNRNRTYGTNSC